ncbi:flagellar M-ring protein FliF [Caldicellulosiruptor hydrothermalis 108]|uniref:Flagellar M-ring protein n=1 Tax=Caldicellulosiruptor hydrothermalis (strain DSM 18901 / VKM B-2411 / 108) TaxID=632292 RepID=E4QCV5_CALH1|nr:flagellar basal-body MS-ring/collar protein FliF [Caldicellulosiruptor hydrothermalis]ADQ06324.1 flagellar M-ring protein FliF [Caldicellulosiruptor hydrothermalis 108]
MPQFLNDFLKNIKEKWSSLSKSQKIMLVVSSSIILLSVIAAIYITTRPHYVTIFSGLDPKEAAEIQNILSEQKIDSKAANGGTTILVRDTDVDRAKMAAAQAGYPKNSSITFEDALKLSSSMTATEADKRRTFIKLKESEIQQALKQMSDYIEDAVVNLSIPEDYTFALKSEATKPTASVKLTLKKSLSSDQIEGIQRFVAASVEGLLPENVVIIDNKGNYLSSNSSDTTEGLSSKQLQLKIATKNEIEKKVKELLGSYVSSPEDVKVSVNLDMNFDMQKISETKYSPVLEDSGIVVSKKTTKEEAQSTNSSSSGVPGTDTNPTQNTTQYPISSQGGQSTYTKTDETVNYQNNEKKIETIKAPGTINYDKSSIAVVLYRYVTYTQEDFEKSDQAKNMSWAQFKLQNQNNKRSFLTDQKEVETIVNLIKSATGIQNVTVEGYEIPTFVDKPQRQIPVDYIYVALAFLLLMVFAASLLIKASKSKPRTVELAGVGPVEISEEKPVAEEILQEAEKRKKAEVEEINVEEFGVSQYEKQIDKLLKEKPEIVAQLLRNWLNEDWE